MPGAWRRTGGSARRVVLDTNVYLSAVVYGGKPELLLSAAYGRRPALSVVISEPILAEIARNLTRTFDWPDPLVIRALAFINAVTEEVRPARSVRAVAHDPDNRVLECAVAGGAGYVVTGDKHLLTLKRYSDITIVTVTEMLDLIAR